MGQACSTGDDDRPARATRPMHLKPAASMNMLLKNESGEFEIDADNQDITLDVGKGVAPLASDILCQLDESCQDIAEYERLCQKHSCSLYFWCVVAFICKGDGVLGEKERRFIKEASRETHPLSSKDFDVVVQVNKNYLQHYVTSVNTVWRDFQAKIKKKELQKKLYFAKQKLLFFAILAASQDGVAKKEFKNISDLGKALKLPQNDIMAMADIVQMELDVAAKMVKIFKTKNPKNTNE